MGSVVNTFEGGTNGTTVTTANSGGSSGNAANTITLDSSTIVFDSTRSAKGGLSIRFSTGATSGSPTWTWSSGFSGTTMYWRGYVCIDANPASNQNIIRLRVGTTIVGTLRINTTGRLQQMYGTGTAGATSTTAMPLGSFVRIEISLTTSTTTTGQMTTRLYTSMDSLTPTETITNTGISTGNAGLITQNLFGHVSSTTNWSIWFDDPAVSTAGWIGPSTTNLARYFPDNSFIDFNPGAIAGNDGGPVSLAMMLRMDDVTNGGLHVAMNNAGGLLWYTELFNNGDLYYSANGDGLWAAVGSAWIGKWIILGVSKADASATPRLHVGTYDQTTGSVSWSHTNAAGAVADAAAALLSDGTIRVGRWSNTSEYYWGAIELDAMWNADRTDSDFEALTSWSAWQGAAVLRRYNQASTGTAVTDLSSAGTGTQKAITGTTITTGNPHFTYTSSTTPVTSDLDLRWKTFGSVNSDLDLRWKVDSSLTPVTSDLDLRWRVTNAVSSDLDIRWRVWSAVTSDMDLRWRVFSSLQSDVDVRWRVLNTVASDIALTWRVAVTVTSDLDLRWRSRSTVTSDLDLRWRVESTLIVVNSDLDLRWRSYARVTSDLGLAWRVYEVTSSDLSLFWRVRQVVTSDLALIWGHEEATQQVDSTLDLRWRTYQLVTSTLTLQWRTFSDVVTQPDVIAYLPDSGYAVASLAPIAVTVDLGEEV